jgi:Rhs element Vgr protein
MLRARLAASRGRVRFQGLSAVQPGSVLSLSRVSDRFNGTVYVTGVRHEFSGGNWTTDAEFGMPRETHAERVAMSYPPAAGLAAAVHGLQIGIVTELAGDPDKEHRIRVKVPLAGMDEQGVWARVATLDAGDQRGTVFRPEKDDEVVLGFLHDDPAQPVVLGMLHSSAKAPPITPTDDNDEKGYVSRSKLALRFDDKKKVAVLETPGGNRLTLSDDDGGVKLEDQNGNSIVLNKDGIALTSEKKAVAIKAKSDLKVEAMNAEIKATSGATVKGSSKAEISSNGQLTVKGSMVMIN